MREEERGRNSGRGEGVAVGGDRPAAQLLQTGIEDSGVLALEQADAPDLLRERDASVGNLGADDLRGLPLHLGVDRREDGGDGHVPDGAPADLRGDLPQLCLVEGGDHAPVEFVAAMGQEVTVANRLPQVVGPVDHRRQ